ncbi:type I-U CRISPR-associated protein Cas5/Cas6 [Oxynema sp. CENA135]|uniref:type I-G CRISPR-associated protein Csb2 n=1 Tax=Oxynema sp. CENA135 TaxID=984206 RepID=UPI00190B259C|nr:type I-U CRISPR-associated protein Csb2 [Oxynema sp. CENA135]MBK4729837.1 type I-U CRISPR-associated protein Cas5/Cas6 [Oxynema sp. CENA135]
MSVTLSIRFLTGRFHATPWNHQVNEGIVEYPPSPWRILRALVSAYYYLSDRPPRDRLCQLVTQLADSLPSYRLPPHTTAHTRHYMPVRKEGKETTTKVLDTFVVFDRATTIPEKAPELQVVWHDVELDDKQRQLLECLCHQLTYLGRAESWCEVSPCYTTATACDARPLGAYEVAAGETTRILVPLSQSEFEGFKTALGNVERPKRAKWRIPQDLLDTLEVDIGELHRQGWSGVPGARWATYTIANNSNNVRGWSVTERQAIARPTVARFDLSSNVLPPLTEALAVGERFRQTLMSRSDDGSEAMETFSGRQKTGEKRQNQRHAWYLPEDSDGDGRIDRLWVFAAEGFGEDAVRVLCGLSKVWAGKAFEVQTRLTGLGTLEDYRSTTIRQSRSLLGCSRIWRSLTPFVLPRHPKKKIDPDTGWQVDGVQWQAKHLIDHLRAVWAIAPLADVRVLSDSDIDCCYPWHAFRRRRSSGKGHQSSDRGYWIELEFVEEQCGPIAIGYGAHFGLGLFVPYFCAEG